MTPLTSPADVQPADAVYYPESDGKPLSESTKQLRWIFLLYGNLSALFAHRPDVFVGGDQFWYPVQGDPKEVLAPDVYLAFGRPKGDRGSYKQWLENDVPLTVVFEVRSPSNSEEEMAGKFHFYDHHGVEEYYDYDPEANRLLIYTRGLSTFRQHHDVARFVSPRLGIRFEMTRPEMTVYLPDGSPFIPYEDLKARLDAQSRRAEDEKRRADEQKLRADDAQRRADDAQLRADDALRQSVRLAELSRKARRNQASPEELAELDRLEQELA